MSPVSSRRRFLGLWILVGTLQRQPYWTKGCIFWWALVFLFTSWSLPPFLNYFWSLPTYLINFQFCIIKETPKRKKNGQGYEQIINERGKAIQVWFKMTEYHWTFPHLPESNGRTKARHANFILIKLTDFKTQSHK